MILIKMKITLKLLFISDFWLGMVSLKNAKHLKKVNEELMPIAWHPRILWNFCMSEDEEKEIEPIFYWVILLMHAIWKYWKILALDIFASSLWTSCHFDTENYTWRLDIVFLPDFLDILSQSKY